MASSGRLGMQRLIPSSRRGTWHRGTAVFRPAQAGARVPGTGVRVMKLGRWNRLGKARGIFVLPCPSRISQFFFVFPFATTFAEKKGAEILLKTSFFQQIRFLAEG